MRAHQIMTTQVITIATSAPIVDAANVMLDKHVSGLPVVDAAGKLVGIVSQGDFIRRAEIGTERKHGRFPDGHDQMLRDLSGVGLHERGH